MKLILLCPSNSRSNGGVATVVQQVGKSLLNQSIDPTIVSFNDEYSDKDRYLYGNLIMNEYQVSSLPILKQLAYSSNIQQVIELSRPDIIDCQGIWGYFSKAAFNYQKKHPTVKRIVTPHGMLDPWALKNSSWKKKLVGWLFENKCLHTADCIHALCQSEYESIRKFGLKNPVAIIPNGINLPTNLKFDRNKDQKVLLFIGRIHPKKGLTELIKGISILYSHEPDLVSKWKFRIAGWNQEQHQQELEAACQTLGISHIVDFIGPVFGIKKEQELVNADAFILPSLSEGLPMSILEAWSYHLPCIMTDYCNIPEGFENRAAIRIEPDAENIADNLSVFLRMDDLSRIEIGNRGYDLCCEKFSWNNIAIQMKSLYTYLQTGGEKPSFIIDN